MGTDLGRPIMIEAKPFNAETPLPALAEPVTPTRLFYVRNHFDTPRIEARAWRLRVDGLVERLREFSLEDVRALPQRRVITTLECAGNGRSQMSPLPPGICWGYGAVGTAEFAGIPLSTLLDQAGLRSTATEVVFVGADRGEVESGREMPFARSLSLDVARHPDTLLAWAMNGEPLTREHGFPLRLVVPGWYGVASVKWLVRISAASDTFDGHFQARQYVYKGQRGVPESTPVTRMRVRAVVARPADGAEVPLGPVEIAGTTWSGDAPIDRVEISVNDGHAWTGCALGEALSPYAAVPWRFRWLPPRSGSYTVTVRAIDRAGNTQPRDPVHNILGYGNNAAHRIRITVGPRRTG